MKKILLVLIMVLGLAVMTGCGGEKYPEISNPNEPYFTAKEGEYTYSVTNQEVYEELKTRVGTNLLLDLIDTDLLKATNKGNKSYWDSVSEEKITEKIEEEIFPKGTEDLTTEEIEEARTEFYDKMFIQYGFNSEAEVRDYYRLTLAKRLYAADHIFDDAEEEDEKDFTEKQYQDYYKNNYKKGYYAIVVAYETLNLVNQALETWGRKIDKGVWTTLDGTPLSETEIVQTFINLYNSANSYKVENYPEASYLLNEGEEYNIVNGQVVFDLEKLDVLYYTHDEINSYEPAIQKRLADNLDSYGTGPNFYQKNPLSNSTGSRYYLVMEIAEKEAPTFEDVKAEIKEKLTEGKLSSTFISTKIAELRAKNNLVIYDKVIEERYINQISNFDVEYKKTKKLNGNLVAKTDVKEYSTDDLFKVMSVGYGLTLTVTKIEYLRLLHNPKFNTIYSMDESLKEADRILDEDQYTAIKKEIEDEKAAFEAGEYKDYGYPASYGWKNFIKDRYGVETEKDVFNQLLYNRVKDAYGKNLGKITSADSELAAFYTSQMEKRVAEYFKVKGVQLVIEVLDENGSKVNPEKWTTTQKEYAELFYKEVLEYLSAELKEGETYQERLQAIVSAHLKAPRFKAGIPQNSASQPLDQKFYVFEGIEISKYKTAGLSVRFADLGTFTNGTKAEALEKAAKEIWDNNPDSKEAVIYGSDNLEDIPYIVTEEGYHVYVNLETTPLAEWDEGKVIPTIEQIIAYEKDASNSALTSKIKTAITTYYKPIYDELIGSYNVLYNIQKEIKELDVSFSHDHFDVAAFDRFLDLQIEKSRNQLKYID